VRDSLRFVENNPTHTFEYSWRSERKEFDSSGKVTSENMLMGEKVTIQGVSIHRLLERNGTTLTDDEIRSQEMRIKETIAKVKAERQRGPGKQANGDEWIREVGDALDFKVVGEETVDGRSAWVLTCSPHAGYSAKNMRARVFEKMNGKLWIDRADRELVRAEAETFDTVNVGLGLLGRIEKGTRFQLTRTRLPEGAWVLDSQNIRFGARVLLVKWVGNEIHRKHWNYRRQ
jgi:hypothetical protein